MEEELDLITLVDDEGNEVTAEILDYFFYEGRQYAVMTEYNADEACGSCEQGECEGCEKQTDAFIMEVRAVGEDEEEFVPIEDELSEKLIDFVNNEMYADDDYEYEDEEDENN